MDKENEIPVSDIFIELASDTRCQMLLMLAEKPHRSTEISKKINMSIQETHRNTSRMTEAGLLIKDSDGFFNLTNYGKVIINQISYFEFFRENKTFFEEHTVGKIPKKFIQRIGSLKNCEMISNVTIVLERLKKIESSTQKELRIMVNQAWDEEGK
ncbi:MAG: winged helix-turn-helix domain-containing protein, partial [Nitrosopumilus sp.]